MTHDLFISYSTKNKDAAETVVSELEERGLRCWMAPRDILPGTPYGQAIVQAIEECQIFLLILSAASNGSKQVLREVDHASSLDKDILPFLVEEIQPSGSMAYYLGPEQWLDATSSSIEDHTQDLCSVLERLLDPEKKGTKAPEFTQEVSPSPVDKLPQEKPVQEPLTEMGGSGPEAAAEQDVRAGFAVRVNPFTFGNPVSTTERFYGRQGDLRQVISRLLSAGESTSVVGERRIGKTSLLKYLANPENAVPLGLPRDKYCLVYIDFQGLTDITPQRFWQRVLRKMEKSVCSSEMAQKIKRLRQQENFDLFDLEDLFEDISWGGITTVLLLDEFEYVTRNPNFKSDFFGGLRALAIHRDLPLITSTRRELVNLCHSDEIKGSPFFNIFVNLVLRPFSEDELLNMLRGYVAETDVKLDPREEQLVLQLSGGYPFFVQMAGYYLLEAKWKGLADQALVDKVIENFDSQAEPHFSYFWSHSTESEKITLFSILTLENLDSTPESLLTIENVAGIHSRAHIDLPELVKRGLLLKDREQDTYALFSSSYKTWISRELAAVSGHKESPESVEEWLQERGVEDEETVRKLLPDIKKKYWPLVGTVVKELPSELVGSAVIHWSRER